MRCYRVSAQASYKTRGKTHHMILLLCAVLCQVIRADFLVPETAEIRDLLMALSKESDPFLADDKSPGETPDIPQATSISSSMMPSSMSSIMPTSMGPAGRAQNIMGGIVNEAKKKAKELNPNKNKKGGKKGGHKKKKGGSHDKGGGNNNGGNQPQPGGGQDAKEGGDQNKLSSTNELTTDKTVNSGSLPISGLVVSGHKSNKIPSSFWANVNINNTVRRVKVSVKTVTVIDSIAPEEVNTKSKTKATTSKSATSPHPKTESKPFIRIQMPEGVQANKKISQSVSSALHPLATLKPSSKKQSAAKTASVAAKSSSAKPLGEIAKSVLAPNSKQAKTSRTYAKAKPTSSTKTTSGPGVVSSRSYSPPRDPEFKFEPGKTPSKTESPDKKAKSDAALNDIFDLLKNIPAGKHGNDLGYVEGKFTFPKAKHLKNREFKLSGYITQK